MCNGKLCFLLGAAWRNWKLQVNAGIFYHTYRVLSFRMSFACDTASKSKLCWQAVFTVKDLLLSPIPSNRYSTFCPGKPVNRKPC